MGPWEQYQTAEAPKPWERFKSTPAPLSGAPDSVETPRPTPATPAAAAAPPWQSYATSQQGAGSEGFDLTPAQVFARNQPYLKPGATGYVTQLAPKEEQRFRAWLKQNGVQFDPNAKAPDYDMRGFWKALQAGDPKAKGAVDPNDGRMHFPDYWKTPYDLTFSRESQWALPSAPRWNDKDQLVDSSGRVVFDDRAHRYYPIAAAATPPWKRYAAASAPPPAPTLAQSFAAVPEAEVAGADAAWEAIKNTFHSNAVAARRQYELTKKVAEGTATPEERAEQLRGTADIALGFWGGGVGEDLVRGLRAAETKPDVAVSPEIAKAPAPEGALAASNPGEKSKPAPEQPASAAAATGSYRRLQAPPPSKPPEPPKPPELAAPAEGPLTRAPALSKPRSLEDQLFQLRGNSTADAIEAKKHLDAVPPGVKPDTWEKLYHHEEDPEGVKLTPEERTLYDKHVAPLKAEADKLSSELEKLGYPTERAEAAGGFPKAGASDRYTPRYVSGRTRSFGEVLDQWRQGVETRFGGAPGRSMRKTVDAQRSRRFWNAVNPETGDKTVVYVGTDGRVLAFDGTPEPIEFGRFGKGQRIAAGSKVRAGGKTWKLEPATTKEIESVAATRYSKNVLANRLDNLAKLRSAVRNARFIKAMTESPEWSDYAVKVSDTAIPPESGGRQWRIPKLPQFRQWYVEPRIADALDDFARDMGTTEGLDTVLNKIGRVMNFVMFINPKAHIDNVLNHMMVERGLVGNVIHAPSTARNLLRATKSVLTADRDYIRALRAGASLPYSRMLSGDLHMALLKKLGGDVAKNPAPWDRLARAAGYPSARYMLKRFGQVPSRVLWAANDIMVLSRINQLAERGIPFEKAIRDTDKGIPNYRVPGQVLGKRWAAELFGNPAWGRFGRYQYGRLAGYFHLLADAFGRGRSIPERAQALDRMAMLGMYLYLFYPAFDYAWRAVTGNQNAETTRSGAAAIPQAVMDVASGKKKIGDLPQSIFTIGVPLELPVELYYGRYNWSGNPIMRDADVRAGRWDQVFRDAGSFAAQQFSTLGQMFNPAPGGETAGQIFARAMGVKLPNDQQVQMREHYHQRDARDAARRANRMRIRRENGR